MKIRNEMDAWKHFQKGGVMTDEDKRIGRGKEAAVFLRELFRAGCVDKIGELLFRGGVLVDDAVFRFFVGFRCLLDPPAGLEKVVKKREKGSGGGAWERAPFRARERVHVDPFADRGEQEERENVGSGSDVDGVHGG
jgi:hypothetical protein